MGDNIHSDNDFGRSYDLQAASIPFASVRYIRIDGAGDGGSGSSTGFDLDAIGAHQVTAVPEPESYAMLMAGLGLLGFTARRMKRKTCAGRSRVAIRKRELWLPFFIQTPS